MRTTIKISAILLIMIMSSAIFAKQASAQQGYVSLQVFYDQLSPYGQWVDYPNYGYVWIPNEGPDFTPYSTGGHWIMTDYGLTWLSDYNWGWAPFHYGRWDYDDYYGWFWVPDYEWGPAWVTWRRASGYYGWAPMEPGISISMSFGRDYIGHNNRWTFVSARYIDRSDINRYYLNRNDGDMIIRNSTVINNTYVDNSRHTTYIAGPAREDLQRATGRRVNTVSVQEYNTPGQDLRNGQLRLYRPQVIRSNDQERRPAPTNITNLKEVRRPSERNPANQPRNINTTGNNRQGQQQNAANQQNAVNRQNAVNKQNTLDQKNAANRQNVVNRQNAVNQQNANQNRNTRRDQQQNAANQQNAVNRQNAVNKQNDANKQNAVDQKNAIDKKNAVNQQNAVNRQNAANQQKAVNQQNNKNNTKTLRQQNVNQNQNNKRVQQINNRRGQQQDTVKSSRNIRK